MSLKKMRYPSFFDNIEPIRLKDPLANFLGALEDGYVEFTYLDVVKNAGHSCPTVAGAFLAAFYGLEALYKDQLPVRGEIEVSFGGDPLEGTNGVIANVFTQITGATQSFGFKGIGGNFARDSLLHFYQPVDTYVTLTNIKTSQRVQVQYTPEKIPADPLQKELMTKIISQTASADEIKNFQKLWQKRVEEIFAKSEDVITLV